MSQLVKVNAHLRGAPKKGTTMKKLRPKKKGRLANLKRIDARGNAMAAVQAKAGGYR